MFRSVFCANIKAKTLLFRSQILFHLHPSTENRSLVWLNKMAKYIFELYLTTLCIIFRRSNTRIAGLVPQFRKKLSQENHFFSAPCVAPFSISFSLLILEIIGKVEKMANIRGHYMADFVFWFWEAFGRNSIPKLKNPQKSQNMAFTSVRPFAIVRPPWWFHFRFWKFVFNCSQS